MRTVYVVGTVPLADTEAVMRALAASVGPALRWVPDGETGERLAWLPWLDRIFATHPSFEQTEETYRRTPGETSKTATQKRYRLKAGIAAQALVAPLFVGDLDMVDGATRGAQRGDVAAHAEAHAMGLGHLRQRTREGVGVARFVLGRVGGPGQLRADVAQRRLELHRLIGDQTEPVEITISPSGTQLLFRTQAAEMVSQIIQGTFPNYQQLIPKSSTSQCKMDVGEFLRNLLTMFSGVMTASLSGAFLSALSSAFDATEGRRQPEPAVRDAHRFTLTMVRLEF